MKSNVIAVLYDCRVGVASPCCRATLRGRGYRRQLLGDRCSPKRKSEDLGNKGGYDSVAAAQKALGSGSGCKGMIDRADKVRTHECSVQVDLGLINRRGPITL